jgi:hypothetical protein
MAAGMAKAGIAAASASIWRRVGRSSVMESSLSFGEHHMHGFE